MASPKSHKNPFVVLGLNADRLRDLNDQQIDVLVQATYKALQSLFHPDHAGGNDAKSQAINQARALLDQKNHPRSYETYKRQFLKKTPINEQISKLQQLLRLQAASKDELAMSFLNYLKLMAKPEDKTTIFNMELPCTLQVHGYFANMQFYRQEKEKKQTGQEVRQKNKELMEYQLVMDENGTLTKIKHGHKTEYPHKVLIGAINHDTVVSKDNSSMLNILRRACPSDSPDKKRRLLMDKYERSSEEQDLVKASLRLSQAEFGKIVHMITPVLSDGCYLFGLNFDAPELYFSLEGRLLEIVTG